MITAAGRRCRQCHSFINNGVEEILIKFSRETQARRSLAFGIQHTGLFSKTAVNIALQLVCGGDLEQLPETNPSSPESHMRVSGMQRHEHCRSRGLRGSCAALLLTLISAAQCRRLRAVPVHEHNKPPHRQWDAIHAAAQSSYP